MKFLCEAGIVTGREDGKWTHYQINKQGCEKAIAMLQEITAIDSTGIDCEKCSK